MKVVVGLVSPRILSAGWLALFAWLSFFSPQLLMGQSNATVTIDPPTLTLDPGETASLAVLVGDANGIYGVEIRMVFDPGVIQIVDADPAQSGVQVIAGDFLDVNQGFLVVNRADNASGVITFAFTLLAPATPADGEGTLLEIALQAVGSDQSDLVLDSVILASPEGQPLPLTTGNGLVIVRGRQPTATRLPNNTPTLVPDTVTPLPTVTPPPTVNSEPTVTPSVAHRVTASPFPTRTGLGEDPAPTASAVVAVIQSPTEPTATPHDPGETGSPNVSEEPAPPDVTPAQDTTASPPPEAFAAVEQGTPTALPGKLAAPVGQKTGDRQAGETGDGLPLAILLFLVAAVILSIIALFFWRRALQE